MRKFIHKIKTADFIAGEQPNIEIFGCDEDFLNAPLSEDFINELMAKSFKFEIPVSSFYPNLTPKLNLDREKCQCNEAYKWAEEVTIENLPHGEKHFINKLQVCFIKK